MAGLDACQRRPEPAISGPDNQANALASAFEERLPDRFLLASKR